MQAAINSYLMLRPEKIRNARRANGERDTASLVLNRAQWLETFTSIPRLTRPPLVLLLSLSLSLSLSFPPSSLVSLLSAAAAVPFIF